MPEQSPPRFRGGSNIAMKVPPHQFEATIAFYRDVVRLPHIATCGSSEVFEFGAMRLRSTRSESRAATKSSPSRPDLRAVGLSAGIAHLVAHPSEDPDF